MLMRKVLSPVTRTVSLVRSNSIWVSLRILYSCICLCIFIFSHNISNKQVQVEKLGSCVFVTRGEERNGMVHGVIAIKQIGLWQEYVRLSKSLERFRNGTMVFSSFQLRISRIITATFTLLISLYVPSLLREIENTHTHNTNE